MKEIRDLKLRNLLSFLGQKPEACTSRPEKETITEDLLEDFSEVAEPNANGRWAGLKKVGKGNFCGWLCKSSEYRILSSRTSSALPSLTPTILKNRLAECL
ncbi:hypothetical protein DPMN_124422 [Dreissena polymorpha]|uniref:Uncharacterized protein n=1 Tax=Dreissena polymorpha TaxID=45954 RepID=A0A9D4JW59_DREPO|nr:hypothetical protein DPMN_124422 [Dreissena polymorpha]